MTGVAMIAAMTSGMAARIDELRPGPVALHGMSRPTG